MTIKARIGIALAVVVYLVTPLVILVLSLIGLCRDPR